MDHITENPINHQRNAGAETFALTDSQFLVEVQQNEVLVSLYHKFNQNLQELLGADYHLPDMLPKIERSLRKSIETTLEFASVDLLTGLPNKLGFERDANQLLRIAESSSLPAVLLSLDLDGFKQLNDNHGHHEGDNALRKFAKILRENLRKSDAIARPHGDEFWIFSIGSNWLAPFIGSRVRELAPSASPLSPLRVSVGASLYKPGDDLSSLFERAELALQWSKYEGKDRTTIITMEGQDFELPEMREYLREGLYVYPQSRGKAPERNDRR